MSNEKVSVDEVADKNSGKVGNTPLAEVERSLLPTQETGLLPREAFEDAEYAAQQAFDKWWAARVAEGYQYGRGPLATVTFGFKAGFAAATELRVSDSSKEYVRGLEDAAKVAKIKDERAKIYFPSGRSTGVWAYVDDLLSILDNERGANANTTTTPN